MQRGFWLYVWKIRARGSTRPRFYVGMTGDTGSYRAQSPVNRVSAHLGHNERNNALRRCMKRNGIEIERCDSIEFAAYGPIGNVPVDRVDYRAARSMVAALEKRLWQHMESEGMDMLNSCPSCTTPYDDKTFELVRSELEPFFKS